MLIDVACDMLTYVLSFFGNMFDVLFANLLKKTIASGS